ncbi:MAG: hypothetical protein P0S94_00920 [Simkaniaceae bacterium]|nr:hypothetical protein [Simkaniaceae bacterium]
MTKYASGSANFALAKRSNGMTTVGTRGVGLIEKGNSATKTAKAAYNFFKTGAYWLMTLIWPFPILSPVARLDPVFATIDVGITSNESSNLIDDPRRKKLNDDQTTTIAISMIALTTLGTILTVSAITTLPLSLAIVGFGAFFINEEISQQKLNLKYI